MPKMTLIITVLLILTSAILACAPTDSTQPPAVESTDALTSTAPISTHDASDGYVYAEHSDPEDDSTFSFSYMYDLDEDGAEEEIIMNVRDYNTPTMTVNDLETGFLEADAASYDVAAQFMVCDTNYGGKLIYFFLLGGRNYGFYAHCAYYENDTLSEVLFPEEFFGNLDEDPAPVFTCEWIDDDTFELKCIYGNGQATVDIDKESYEQTLGKPISDAGEAVFNDILNDYELDKSNGDMKAAFVLEDADYHDFVRAYITLNFNREEMRLIPDVETLTYELNPEYDFLSITD